MLQFLSQRKRRAVPITTLAQLDQRRRRSKFRLLRREPPPSASCALLPALEHSAIAETDARARSAQDSPGACFDRRRDAALPPMASPLESSALRAPMRAKHLPPGRGLVNPSSLSARHPC